MAKRAGTRAHTSHNKEGVVRSCPDSGHESAHLVRVLGVRDLVSVSGARDERIGQIGRLQRGRAARRQLRQAGISDSVITRLVLEVEGYRDHSSERRSNDRRKDTVFRAAALDAIRVSSDQVFDEPYLVIALIAMAIARAGMRVAA